MAGRLLAGAALSALILAGCSSTGQTANDGTGTTNSSAAGTTNGTKGTTRDGTAAQTNPPGDIPDTQLFVTYRSPAGYSVLSPEGWSRTTNGSAVTFTSNYDGEQVSLRAIDDPRAAIRTMFPNVSALKVSHASIRGTPSTLLTYTSTSKQDPVTGRSITLENESFVVTHGSREAILSLWAPKGSDNVDQWKKISQSFQWK